MRFLTQRRGPLGDSSLAAWAATGLVVGITLLAAYVLALRYDASPIIVAVGTMAVLAQLRDGAQQAFPGALYGGLLGALVTWGVFRRSGPQTPGPPPTDADLRPHGTRLPGRHQPAFSGSARMIPLGVTRNTVVCSVVPDRVRVLGRLAALL